MPMATKLGSSVTYLEGFWTIKSYCQVVLQDGKQNLLYLYYQIAYGQLTWHDGIDVCLPIKSQDYLIMLCCEISDKSKLLSTIFYQIFIFSPNDSPSKTMKNVFLFHLKNSFRKKK